MAVIKYADGVESDQRSLQALAGRLRRGGDLLDPEGAAAVARLYRRTQIITNVEMGTSTRCVAVSIWQYYLVIVLKTRLYIGFPAWNKNVPQSISLRISLHACRFWLAG
jgi:hypothetical protein